MTDFTDERKYSVAEIRAAANALQVDLTETALGDALIAALEKPEPKFREGEVVAHEFMEDDQPTMEYVAFDAIGCWDGCRRLRLSEMPQAVETLRAGAGKARRIAELIAQVALSESDKAHARDIVDALDIEAFDKDIEP